MSRSASPASKPTLTIRDTLADPNKDCALVVSRPASRSAAELKSSMALRAVRAKTIYLSYCNTPSIKSGPDEKPNFSAVDNAMVLKKHFLKHGYTVIEHDGSNFEYCRLNEIDQTSHDDLDRSCIFVACVTREYHKNKNCKALCRIANSKITRERGKPFEVCFVTTTGDYTILSDEPYRIKGWLYYLMKDALTYCGWSPSHLFAACEAIVGMSTLITKEMDIETGENRAKMLEWKADIARKYPYMSLPSLPTPKPLSTAVLMTSPNATLSPIKPGRSKRSVSSGGHGSHSSHGRSSSPPKDKGGKGKANANGTSSAGHTPANVNGGGSFFPTEVGEEEYPFEEN
jgi:hypothetical protein